MGDRCFLQTQQASFLSSAQILASVRSLSHRLPLTNFRRKPSKHSKLYSFDYLLSLLCALVSAVESKMDQVSITFLNYNSMQNPADRERKAFSKLTVVRNGLTDRNGENILMAAAFSWWQAPIGHKKNHCCAGGPLTFFRQY